MIFVTVGLHDKGFDRLVRSADEMASDIEDPVVVQRGSTPHIPQYCQHFDYADEAQMRQWITKARVVISHGGAGSILSALQAGKPLVVAPRLACFDEHIDDHQRELAEALARQNKVVSITELSPETLWQAVVRATQLASQTSASHSLQDALRTWLNQQSRGRAPMRWRWRRLCRRR